MLADAAALGVGSDMIERYFSGAAQRLVNDTSLTGEAFDELVTRFPALAGRVRQFDEAMAKTSTTAEIAARKLDYLDRIFAANNDTSTLGGALAEFDRKAAQERKEEAQVGGKAMVELEAALFAERLKIVRDFAKQDLDLAKGKLQEAYDAQKETIDTAIERLEAFRKSITEFRNSLLLSPETTLSPEAKVDEARRQFRTIQSAAAASSIPDMEKLQDASQAYLDAGKSYYASSTAYAAIFDEVRTSLTSTDLRAGQEIDAQQQQLAALERQVAGLIEVKAAVLSVADAVGAVHAATAELARLTVDNGAASTSVAAAVVAMMTQVQAVGEAQIAAAVAAVNRAGASQDGVLGAIFNGVADTVGLSIQIRDTIAAGDRYTHHLLERVVNNVWAANVRSGATPYATGGWVTGPGTGTSDSIAARLSAGEFVVNAADARRAGPLLEGINAGGMPLPMALVGPANDDGVKEEIRLLRAEVRPPASTWRSTVSARSMPSPLSGTTLRSRPPTRSRLRTKPTSIRSSMRPGRSSLFPPLTRRRTCFGPTITGGLACRRRRLWRACPAPRSSSCRRRSAPATGASG